MVVEFFGLRVAKNEESSGKEFMVLGKLILAVPS